MLKKRTPAFRLLARLAAATAMVAGVLATFQGPAKADTSTLTLVKSASVTSVAVNTPFDYVLKYSCSSLTTTCDGVTITDVLPPELSRAAADVTLTGDGNTATTSYNPATGTATFTMVSPMRAGTTGDVTITVRFPPNTTPVGTQAVNTADISATNAATVTSNPVEVDVTGVNPSMSLTKSTTSRFVLDAPIVYTVPWTNNGNTNLLDPTVVDTVPPGAMIVSCAGGARTCVIDRTANTVTWFTNAAGASAPPGQSNPGLTVTVIYPSTNFTVGTPITNTAVASATPPGTTVPITQPAMHTGIPVEGSPAISALKIQATPTGTTVQLGRNLTYNVTATNTGNVPLSPVTITDTLPPGTTFVSCGNVSGSTCLFNSATNQVTWSGFTSALAAGGGFTVTLKVRYTSPPFNDGDIARNVVDAKGTPTTGGADVTGSYTLNTTLNATGPGLVAITKGLTPNSVVGFVVGVPQTYTVTVTNNGEPLTNVRITDPLPTSSTSAPSTFVSCSTPAGVTCARDPGTNTVTWTIANLGADQAVTLSVVVIFPAPGFAPGESVTNCVSGAGVNADNVTINFPNPGPLCRTDQLAAATPRANITKTFPTCGTTLAIGASCNYQIAASNTGTSPLTGFTVTDMIPANLQPTGVANNVTFVDTRTTVVPSDNVLQWLNPDTGDWVDVPTTCTPAGTCTGSIPTAASGVRIIYAGTFPVQGTPAPDNVYATTITLSLQVPPSGVDRNGHAINQNDAIVNSVQVSADQLPIEDQPHITTSQTVLEPRPTMTLTKTRTTAASAPPASTVVWNLTFGTVTGSPVPTINPTVTDCLPAALTLVNPANPSDPANGGPPTTGPFAPPTPPPSITTAPGNPATNGCAAGTTAVIWSWATASPALTIPAGITGVFTLRTVIAPGTASGTVLTNLSFAKAVNNPTPTPNATANVTVTRDASLASLKQVKGSLDADFGTLGHTTIGGSADYRLTVTNTGNIPINKISVVDILPFVGDTAVLNPADLRLSDWEPILVGAVSAPSNVTVEYSTSTNPCRPLLVPSGPPGCDPGTFSTALPSPISLVRSLQFTFDGTLAGGQTLTLSWPMTTPVNAPVNGTAWNSFAFTGFRTDTGAQVAPAEPNKVGFLVEPYPLKITKLVNGSPEPDPPGLFIPVGDPVTYTYEITNPGDLQVNAVDLTDSTGVAITSCSNPPLHPDPAPLTPATIIEPHSDLVCTADAGPALSGVHADTASVTGQPLVDGEPAGDRTAEVDATAHYNGVTPSIRVRKLVNGHHRPRAPGVLVPVGSTVDFTYRITNTGDVTLDPVTLNDSVLGEITSCPAMALAPGDSMTCDATTTALEGQHSDIATATGQPVDEKGAPVGPEVAATDRGNYEAITPMVDTVVKDAAVREPWNNTEVVGSSAFDTATVAGRPGRPNPTGTVTYSFFHNHNCTGTAVTTQDVTLRDDGSVPDSNDTAPLAAGSYSFLAHYGGDTNFAAATSECEPFSVDKAPTQLTTTPFNHATGAAWTNNETTGARAFDTATLTGAVDPFTPTGTVTYHFFRDGNCDGAPDTTQVVDLNDDGTVPESDPTGPLAAGLYAFKAIYSGDGNYTDATSGCEIFRVNPATAPLSTRVFDFATGHPWTNTEVAGSRAVDHARLHDVVSGFIPTGTVTYSFFHNGNCSGDAFTTEPVVLDGGAVPDSAPTDPLETGHYSFRAVYSGDDNYASFTSRCEPFSVGKATPAITTDPSAGVPVGNTIWDTATVSGGSNPTGSVTFKLFPPSDAECTGTPVFEDTIGLSGGLEARSGNFEPEAAGTYRWIATYNGDGNNAIVSTGCDEEEVIIGRAQPDEVTTQPLPPAGPIGTVIADSATVSGGHNPTGTVTFRLFAPGNDTCRGRPVFVSRSHLAGDPPTANSASFTTTQVGTYRWVARYNGDANNLPRSSGCDDEPVTISKAMPTIQTIPSPNHGPVGIDIRDRARVTGGHNPTGTVTFKLYPPTDPTCSGTPVLTQTRRLRGTPPGTRSGVFTTTAVGTYRWVATYNGDDHNESVMTGCDAEPVTIIKATPTIETQVSQPTATAGTHIFDTATLHGGTGPTGTITFRLFGPGNDTCRGRPVFTDVGTLGTEPPLEVTSRTFTPTVPGTYRWVATYNGDTNNVRVRSGCDEEQVVIIKATPTIETSDFAGGVVGTSITDTAHVTGGSNPTGNVTFRLFPASDTTCTGNPVFMSTNRLIDGSATSGSFPTTVAGRFNWVATYEGDGSNNAISSGCGDEPVKITRATPNIGTTPSPGGVVGVTISDQANVTGGFNPTGRVRFELFPPEDATCSGAPVFTSTNPLTAGSATSGSFTPGSAGTWHWVAIYSGDRNNNRVSTGCNDEPVTLIARHPAITIAKKADTATFSTVGTLITYTYTITNTGNVTLTNVHVTDSRLGPVPGCSIPVLDPMETHVCTATHLTTQADLDRGKIINTATVTGTENGRQVTNKSNKVRIRALQRPAIGIAKSASVSSFSRAGTPITYYFDVVNSGNVTLHEIYVTDTRLGKITCPQTTLAAGASMRCQATLVTTQADVDRGFIANSAKVTGFSPTEQKVTHNDQLTIKAVHRPAISIAKSASISSFSTAGTLVTYRYTVTNTGNVTLRGVSVTDSLGMRVTCPLTTLVPGQAMQCTATRRITQADVNRGRVTDTATVTTTSPRLRAGASLTIPAVRRPAISISKTGNRLTFSQAGTPVRYFYTITNTGTVSLHDIRITDNRLGQITCPRTVLAPGERMICKASHVINPLDVRLGKFTDIATVTGIAPNGTAVTDLATFTLVKSSIPGPVVPPVKPPTIPVTG